MSQEKSAPEKLLVLFDAHPRLAWLVAALILLGGVALRLTDLDDPPLDFHPTRQLHSALIARGMYYARLDSVPEWQRERAVQQQREEGLIEPQVMETLAALSYRLAGQADLRIPRVFSILFWSLGGVGIFLLAKELAGYNGGIVALLLYMSLPYGVIASRSFQPDPLMTALIVWSWWAMLHWSKQRNWQSTVLAGLTGGLAIYVKSTAVFFVGSGWLGLVLVGFGLRAALRERQLWLAAGLLVLPYAGYHIYTTSIGALQEQFSLRFFPQMWFDPVFYLRWQLKAAEVVALPWLLLGVLGLFTLREKAGRGFLTATWLGYGLYGLVFSYYVSTHDYYHLPLIPLAALGSGAALQALLATMQVPRRVVSLVIPLLLLGLLLSHAWEARSTLRRVDYRPVVAQVEQISALFTSQDRLVSLAEDYSAPLRYWGWLDATHWFGSGDFALRELAGQPLDLQAYFEQQTAGKDYFLVIDFIELARQPQLKTLLAERFPVIWQGEGYIVYDLRREK